MLNRYVVISGCSGGGKSTLLSELARRGYATVEEPGRRIVREELGTGGSATPWSNPEAFARRAVAMALDDLKNARANDGWVFFDRSLIDAAAALEHATAEAVLAPLAQQHRYHRVVFFTPPWPELFQCDGERRHDFDAARAEYERLLTAYPAAGYRIFELPKIPVAQRADSLLSVLPDLAPASDRGQ